MIPLTSHVDITKKGIAHTGQTRPIVFAMGDVYVVDRMLMASVVAIDNKKAPTQYWLWPIRSNAKICF